MTTQSRTGAPSHVSEYARLSLLVDPLRESVLRRAILALGQRRFHDAGEHAEGVRWLQSFSEGLDHEGRKQANEAMARLREVGGLAPAEEQ